MSEHNEVLEYVFFSRTMAGRFISYLQEHKLTFEEEIEPVEEAIVLKIAEGVSDELWDELDDLYDELNAEDQALMEAGAEDETAKSTAGVYLQLAGGGQTIAPVDPVLMNRILEVLSMDEFNRFVDTIVRAVENPDDSAICQRTPD